MCTQRAHKHKRYTNTQTHKHTITISPWQCSTRNTGTDPQTQTPETNPISDCPQEEVNAPRVVSCHYSFGGEEGELGHAAVTPL